MKGRVVYVLGPAGRYRRRTYRARWWTPAAGLAARLLAPVPLWVWRVCDRLDDLARGEMMCEQPVTRREATAAMSLGAEMLVDGPGEPRTDQQHM